MSTATRTKVLTFVVFGALVASFSLHAAPTETLDVNVIGAGSVTSSPAGIDCPGVCSADFPKSAKVTLTALPEADVLFLGWSGDCEGTGTICKVAMTKFRSVSAEFGFPPPPAPIPKTGLKVCLDDEGGNTQVTIPCEGTGQDAETQAGIAWPDPRFTDNGDGTVRDNLTGIVWLQNADCFGRVLWTDAMQLALGIGDGDCGLADGSQPGDWRIPNIRELLSIIDYGLLDVPTPGMSPPAIQVGHPFVNVWTNGDRYWSSTSLTSTNNWTLAIVVDMRIGTAPEWSKMYPQFAWPIRNW